MNLHFILNFLSNIFGSPHFKKVIYRKIKGGIYFAWAYEGYLKRKGIKKMSYAIIRNANYKKDNLAGLYKHNERKNTA